MPVRRSVSVRRPSVLVNAVLGVAVVGGAIWAYTLVVQPQTSAAAGNGGARTVAVSQGTVTATVSASGSVRSASTASAAFGTAGTVTEILVKVGDVVKKDAVLARVDPTAAQRQLTAASANLTAAQAALARATTANTDTTAAAAAVTIAQQDVAKAQQAVDGTVLKATMAGTVTAVNGTVGGPSAGGTSTGGTSSGASPGGGTAAGASGGTSSSAGTSSSNASSAGFVQIADLTKLEVSASVAEADATKLKVGQAADVSWNALPGATATAKLASVDPTATTSNNVVTYGVVFSLDQLPNGVRAGQTVQLSVTVGRVDNVVNVNSAALTTLGTRHTVTVLRNGQQVVTPVQVGLIGDQAVEITSGIQVGERVVVKTSTTSPSGGNGAPGGARGGGFPGGGGFSGGGRARSGG
jgi:macrolide-specific efflux system membrane fusion protein